MIFFGRKRGLNSKVSEVIKSSVYSLGKVQVEFICYKFGFNIKTRLKNLRIEDLQKIEDFVYNNFFCGKDAYRFDRRRINRYLLSGSYRGLRMKQGLPVRGQRTHTNRKTARRINSIRSK